jgi:hypothetical protein
MTHRPSQFVPKESEISEAYDEIKAIDTSRYKSHPMVEKLLVFQMEELKKRVIDVNTRCETLMEDNEKLKIEVAVHRKRQPSDRLLEWIRGVAGIGLGVSAGLIFSNDPLLSKAGIAATPLL